MAEISVFGINSGFDSADVVRKLVALNQRPLDLAIARRDLEIEKLTTFQTLRSRLQSFKSILTTLNTANRLKETKGEFFKSSAGTGDVVSITTTSLATSGSFSLTVNNLAQETKLISAGFESLSSSITEGFFEINVGGKTTLIKVDSTNNSLDGLRLAINNSGADVLATFVDDGSDTNSIRLVLSGRKTGEDNAVTARGFVTGMGVGEVTTMSFSETQTAQDASLTLDGINITKSSNTISDVISGATLTLTSAGSGTIKISTDIEEIKTKITSFVSGYNDLLEFIQDLLKFDQNTLESGTLFGNIAVQGLQNTLRRIATGRVAGAEGQFNYLSQVGIKTKSDGKLSIDSGVLTTALVTDLNNVSQLFSSEGTPSSANVTFIGFTEKTLPGSYDLRVSGGVPQISPAGQNQFVAAVGSGNFFAGADGTAAEGLNFRTAVLTDGSLGTIDLSIGVAELLNREISFLTDTTRQGPLETELDTITKTIDELNETLFALDERLELFEQNIKNKFINLEINLGRLNTQKETFSMSLTGLQNLFSKK